MVFQIFLCLNLISQICANEINQAFLLPFLTLKNCLRVPERSENSYIDFGDFFNFFLPAESLKMLQ